MSLKLSLLGLVGFGVSMSSKLKVSLENNLPKLHRVFFRIQGAAKDAQPSAEAHDNVATTP